MARDLLPLVAAQRAAIARSRQEIEDLDRHLAVLETTLQAGGVDPDLCLEKEVKLMSYCNCDCGPNCPCPPTTDCPC